MKSASPSVSPAPSLDRRSFLRLSSIAAVASIAGGAAVASVAPPTQGVEPPGPAPRRAGSGTKPELYGRWFAV